MKYCIFFLFSFTSLFAREEMPWFEQPFEIQTRLDSRYQHFSQIQRPGTNVAYHSDDLFVRLSGEVSPWQDIDAEIELNLAHTLQRQFAFDSFRLTGRYLFYDDLLGDPLSLAAGATLTKAWKHAVRDPSTFYHGRLEAEAHCAIGREVPCAPMWLMRFWTFVALGIADTGSPWWRWNIAWEHNFCDRHYLRLFTHTLWGAGSDAFPSLIDDFDSYGLIHHQSVDIGIRYFYIIPYFGNVNITYSYRPYALNFPLSTHNITLQFLYIIGF